MDPCTCFCCAATCCCVATTCRCMKETDECCRQRQDSKEKKIKPIGCCECLCLSAIVITVSFVALSILLPQVSVA